MVEDQAIRVSRMVPAPPTEVFRAWTEPARLAEWFGPGAFTVAQPREGGPVTLVGTYREIEPPRRLVFTWDWRHAWPDQPESVVTVELTEVSGGTECVVTHTGFGSDHAAYREGWESGLDKLVRRFAAVAVRAAGGEPECPWPSTS